MSIVREVTFPVVSITISLKAAVRAAGGVKQRTTVGDSALAGVFMLPNEHRIVGRPVGESALTPTSKLLEWALGMKPCPCTRMLLPPRLAV